MSTERFAMLHGIKERDTEIHRLRTKLIAAAEENKALKEKLADGEHEIGQDALALRLHLTKSNKRLREALERAKKDQRKVLEANWESDIGRLAASNAAANVYQTIDAALEKDA